MHRRERSGAVIFAVVFAGIFVALFTLVCRRIFHGHTGDFRHFYFASGALLDHRDMYGTMPIDVVERALHRQPNQTEIDWYTKDTDRYLYPPLIAFLYTPIARMQYEHAAMVALAVNCLMAATAIRLAARLYISRLGFFCTPRLMWSVALLGMLLNIDKLRGELQMLQTNALMLLMFVLGLRWLDRRPLLAGTALGVILNIKYLSLAMVPYLIVRRRWKALAAFIASSIFFALLPATISGWSANLASLKIAFGGLFHMVGVGGGDQANVEDIGAMFSVSITSAMSRLTRLGISMQLAMAGVAVIALLVLGTVIAMYRRKRFPVFKWPASSSQMQQPYRALVALEWSGLITAALVFSPQTNTRHLLMAIFVTIPLAALLLAGGKRIRKPLLIAAAIIMFLGFILPFGSNIEHAAPQNLRWTRVGGASWCLLLAFLVVLWNGLRQAKETPQAVDSCVD